MSRRPPLSAEERAERATEIKAIHDDLAAKFAGLTTSDEWTGYLAFAARFHRYSPFNVLWLSMQAAERGMPLSHVAGFRAWQKLGRQVRKGEKALKVLAPSRYKVTDETSGEDRWAVRGFTLASVFDASQTDGDPLPDLTPRLLADGGEQAVLDALVALTVAAGFTHTLVDPADLHGANGRTTWSERAVTVRNDVALAQTIKTTAHELAHVYLHDPAAPEPRRLSQDRIEVEAESVAYVVLTHLGITADDYSLPYVARWSGGDADAVSGTAEVVVKAAHRIIEALEPAGQEQVA